MSEGSASNVGGGSGLADERARELIGQAIRVRREKAQMPQADAARALGISRDTLIRWEQGTGSLWTGDDAGCTDLQMMGKLRELYACKFSEILPRNQYPNAPLDPAKRRDYFAQRNRAIQEAR